MGEQKELDITHAPLMSKLQTAFLDQYIRGVQKQMQGQILGEPYGGASTESYDPRTFELSGTGTSRPVRGSSDPRDRGPRERERPPREREGPHREGPQRERPSVNPRPPLEGPHRGSSFFNLRPNTEPSPLSQLFSAPFMQAFQAEMTGNYPKRGG